jgi:hypothetical protein
LHGTHDANVLHHARHGKPTSEPGSSSSNGSTSSPVRAGQRF